MFIKEARPSIIKNSRKEKTIQIEIKTLKGRFISSAPSGKSKGKYEIKDYNERGIEYSSRLLKVFCERLKNKNFIGKDFQILEEFESLIRKFEAGYGKIGGNCTYALETCFLKAIAKENKKELWKFIHDSFYNTKKIALPVPIGNCIGGGLHSRKSRESNEKVPDFQEFLLIPFSKKRERFSRAVARNIFAYEYAKKILKKKEKKWKMEKNDENAWRASLKNEEVLEILKQVGEKYNLKIGIDIAGSSFYKNGYYHYKNKELIRDRLEQIEYIERLIKKYNLFYVEDPLQEDDFSGFLSLTSLSSKTKNKTLIAGDDLTATNYKRVLRALTTKSINSVIIKPNQVGSLVEVAKVVGLCKNYNAKIIFSHRSGETMDDALADYAVGFEADFIKTGISGRERLIKLRRIIEIEKSLG